MYLLYLDRYHLGDPLFLTGFARDVKAMRAPVMLVHGSGEAAEMALEAEGRFPERRDGLLVAETPEEQATIARATRELNRQIVHALNEAGVSAVRMEATSRGLLRAEHAGVEVGQAEWLRPLVLQGAVPVVAALAAGEGPVREVSGGSVLAALARALVSEGEPPVAAFLTAGEKAGLKAGIADAGRVALADVPAGVLPEPEAVRGALAGGARVLVTDRSGLRGETVEGVWIVA